MHFCNISVLQSLDNEPDSSKTIIISSDENNSVKIENPIHLINLSLLPASFSVDPFMGFTGATFY
jgi:hypothetical protein